YFFRRAGHRSPEGFLADLSLFSASVHVFTERLAGRIMEGAYVPSYKRFVGSEPSVTPIETEHEEIAITEARVIAIEFFDCSKLVSLQLVDGSDKHSLSLFCNTKFSAGCRI